MQYRTVDDKVTKSNFTPEELMRYTHNINMLYRRLPGNKDKEVVLYPVDITDDADEDPGYVTGFEPRVYLGGEPIHSNREELNELLMYTYTTQEWFIADLTVNIRYLDTTLPSEWIQRIAPYILAPSQSINRSFLMQAMPTTCPANREVFTPVDPWDSGATTDSEEDVEIEGVFVTDPQLGDPRRTHSTLYFSFVNTLLELYRRGTIDFVSDQFVAAWELEEDANYRGLYHPKWTNTLVAPDQSKYLLRVSTAGKPESYADEMSNPIFDMFGKNRCINDP